MNPLVQIFKLLQHHWQLLLLLLPKGMIMGVDLMDLTYGVSLSQSGSSAKQESVNPL